MTRSLLLTLALMCENVHAAPQGNYLGLNRYDSHEKPAGAAPYKSVLGTFAPVSG